MIDQGYGVYLDRIRPDEIERMRVWRNQLQIRSWCRQNDLIHDLDQLEWYDRQRKDRSIQMYAIRSLSEELLGVCGLTSMDLINRNAEFSLYIAPRYQRCGYAESALKTLIHHGFYAYGLNHIFGESFEGNPAHHLFEKIGFKKEGERRGFYYRDGRYINAHLYSLLRSEWDHLVSTCQEKA